MSSVIPEQKYSSSGSLDWFSKYRTASEGRLGAPGGGSGRIDVLRGWGAGAATPVVTGAAVRAAGGGAIPAVAPSSASASSTIDAKRSSGCLASARITTASQAAPR